jgi:hypothetical protein
MSQDGKPRGQTRRRWIADDRRQAVAVCTLFVVALLGGLATLVTRPPPYQVRMAVNAVADDDLTTGSIVLVPTFGNTCRHRLIDNATWIVRDNGIVDCRSALTGLPHGRRVGWSAARVDVIRQGFANRGHR